MMLAEVRPATDTPRALLHLFDYTDVIGVYVTLNGMTTCHPAIGSDCVATLRSCAAVSAMVDDHSAAPAHIIKVGSIIRCTAIHDPDGGTMGALYCTEKTAKSIRRSLRRAMRHYRAP